MQSDVHGVAGSIRHINQGFSLLELVVVITMIGVLIAIAALKLPAWQTQTERAALENVAGSLQSALGIRLASYVAGNDMAGLRRLEASNPMDQLSNLPDNYIGIRHRNEMQSIQGGVWYFDAEARELVYRVRAAAFAEATAANEVRYTVHLVSDARGQVEGVKLVQVQSYVWPDGY